MLKKCFGKASQTSPKPAGVSPSLCFTPDCSLLPHLLTQIAPRAAARDAAASFFRVGNCSVYFHAEHVCESTGCSVASDSLWPVDLAHQAPLSRGFSRQEYWSGLPCSSPRDSSQPRDQIHICLCRLHLQMSYLPLVPPGKPSLTVLSPLKKNGSLVQTHFTTKQMFLSFQCVCVLSVFCGFR